MTELNPAHSDSRKINLALQGGGSHGAFTWGVLDTLLQDSRIDIEGVSGASAGAVNAVALAHGFASGPDDLDGKKALARETLANVWNGVAGLGSVGAMATNIMKMFVGGWASEKVSANLLGNVGQWGSPYQLNPLDINPLRKLVEEFVDFDALAKAKNRSPKVYVSATHVKTGRAEVFTGNRLTLNAVMASACLPTLFQAVEINGEDYWDGGFSANPALSPLIDFCDSTDLVLVQINPLKRGHTPQTPADIVDRVNELTFNQSLLAQMNNIDFINTLIAEGKIMEGTYKHLLLHRIDGGADMDELSAASKLSSDGEMINKLFEMGKQAAKKWLSKHFDDLGQKSSINIRRDYVGGAMRS